MRAGSALVGALAASALSAAPALAATTEIERAAQALGTTSTVYVDPGAPEQLSASERQDLQARISQDFNGLVYIAVVPESGVEGSPYQTAIALGELEDATEVQEVPGVYVVYADGVMGAATDARALSGVDDIARSAGSGDGTPFGELSAFLAELPRPGGGQPTAGAQPADGGPGFGVFLPFLLLIGAVFFVSRLFRRRRQVAVGGGYGGYGYEERPQLSAAEFAEVRKATEEDLVALGSDIRALDLDVEMPGVDTRARDAYGRALELYDQAGDALDAAQRPEDIERVTALLEEGRYEMSAARAHLAGRPAPERRPPCFFDPRHGPSDRDVLWTPPGGQPREVPACEADALRVEEGEEPHSREVEVGGRNVPYWNAPGYFSPWAGGYYGIGAGFLGGLLISQMLMPPVVFGAPGDLGGEGGDWGGGDAGGGDWGGGGGDWGGGGGDWGGGGGDF